MTVDATSTGDITRPADGVTVTIDGYQIAVPKGTLVIRAAEMIGITIPRFCDHPLLDPIGACRQCLVDIEGQRKPLASCTTVCTDGMVVKTQYTSPVAEKAQRGVMELLLVNHPLDFEGVGAAGSMLGTRALQLFDDTTCVLRAALRWTEFYQHESCGKCTPCREGTYWLVRTVQRLENGEGTDEDLETILDVSDNIVGRAFCALGDAAPVPISSAIKYFRDEIIQHQKQGGCPFDPAASTLWADR